MSFVDLCRRLVGVDSSQTHGTRELAQILAELAWSKGLAAEIYEESHLGVEQALLFIKPSSTPAPADFLLLSQIETHDPGDYGRWTKTGANPYNASIEGDTLYGLGVSRSKLDFLAKLMALAEFNNAKFTKLNPILVGGYGLESGMGALKLIRRKLARPKAALVGQPTNLRLSLDGPGYAILELSIPFSDEEKNHHKRLQFADSGTTQTKMFSARPSLTSDRDYTENPIAQVFHYLKNLPEGLLLVSLEGGASATQLPTTAWLEVELSDGIRQSVIPKLVQLYDLLQHFAAEFRAITCAGFEPAHSTFNLGSARTTSDGIRIAGSCRFVPNVTADHYQKWLGDLQRGCENLGGKFELVDFREPFHGEENGALSREFQGVLQEFGLETGCVPAKTCSDANILSRFRVETLVFGPGQSVGDSQVENEHIRISDLEKAVQIYRRGIERMCL